MRSVRHKSFPALVFGATVAAPAVAFAGNGLEPRTPVAWPDDTACLTVVDRTQGAMLHLDYSIPYEDADVTPDEVADSRRHQFIAFCRDHSREEFLPTWLSWKDVDAAAAKMLVDPLTIEDEQVLETSTVWKDCWFRITADDDRRPITFAQAMKGVDWDTTVLPAGPYVVQGYTWEPWVNIYSQRPGVVHVVDGPDLAAVGPAAAVSTKTDVTFAEDPYVIEGCARALPGSTLTGYWSLSGGGMLDWQPFAEDVPLDGETFELPFLPPPAAAGKTVALRVDVSDPMQRTFSAYPLVLVTVLPGGGGDNTTGCDPEASFIADPCDTSGTGGSSTTGPGSGSGDSGADTSSAPGSPGSSTGNSSDSGTATEPMLEDGPSGCSCDVRALSFPAWVVGVLLALRRRRCPHGSR